MGTISKLLLLFSSSALGLLVVFVLVADQLKYLGLISRGVGGKTSQMWEAPRVGDI